MPKKRTTAKSKCFLHSHKFSLMHIRHFVRLTIKCRLCESSLCIAEFLNFPKSQRSFGKCSQFYCVKFAVCECECARQASVSRHCYARCCFHFPSGIISFMQQIIFLFSTTFAEASASSLAALDSFGYTAKNCCSI